MTGCAYNKAIVLTLLGSSDERIRAANRLTVACVHASRCHFIIIHSQKLVFILQSRRKGAEG